MKIFLRDGCLKLCVLFVSLLLTPNCFCRGKSELIPAWHKDVESQYPGSRYVRAEGGGASEKAAKDNAVAEISLYFNAKTDLLMSSVSEACKVEKNGESFSSSEESYGENLNISSEAEFFGVAFTDVWYEKKSDTFYVLAYIDRNEALSVYSSRVSYLFESISSYKAVQKKEAEPLHKAFAIHKEAALANLATQYIRNLEILDSSTIPRYRHTLIELTQIPQELASVKSGMTFTIHALQKDERNKGLLNTIAAVLEEQGFSYSEQEAFYTIEVDLICLEEDYKAGPFVRPTLKLIVLNSKGKSVYSYSKAYPKTGAKTFDLAYTRAFYKVQTDLKENLLLEYR